MKQAYAVLFSLAALAMLSSFAAAQQCGVEILSGDAQGNKINFTVKNTGSSAETVESNVFVNGGLIYNTSSGIQEGETASFTIDYDFAPDNFASYEVKMKAHADCGSNHTLTVVHWVFSQYTCSNPQGTETQNRCDYPSGQYLTCTGSQWVAESRDQYCNNCRYHCGDGICSCGESASSCSADCSSSCTQGYTSSYSCSGNIRQRQYKYINCTVDWVAQQLCMNGCYNGNCINQTTPNCGVQISSFDYVNQVVAGTSGYATVRATNTGEAPTRINTSLWLDGVLKDFRYQNTVDSGADFLTTLSYPVPSGGQHFVLIKSNAGCGAEDSRTSFITTISSSQQPVGPNPVPPIPPAQKVTLVSFYPSFMDMLIDSSKIVGIDIITSKPQNFAITVSGLPSGWIQYSSTISVSDEKMAYVYVTSRSAGNYTLDITARPSLENLTFSATIPIFITDFSAPSGQGFLGDFWNNAKGGLKYLVERPLLLAGAMILIIIIVILIGHRHLKRERWPL